MSLPARILRGTGHALVRLSQRFRRDEKAATAVEFAIISVPFLALLMAIFETTFVLFNAEIVDAVTANVSRQLMTGQIQTNGQTCAQQKQAFQDMICPASGTRPVTALPSNFDCTKVIIDVRQSTAMNNLDESNTLYTKSVAGAVRPGPAGPEQHHPRHLPAACHPADPVGLQQCLDQHQQVGPGAGHGIMEAYPHGDFGLPDGAVWRRRRDLMLSVVANGRRRAIRLLRFLQASEGIAAVEFALILPLMLTLYFGSAEVTQAIRASRKVDLVAGALANLASQQLTCATSATACLTDTDMTGSNGIFTAAPAILSPYTTTDLTMTISQINITTYNGNLIAKVDWTVTNNGGTARPCNGGGANNSLLAGNVAPGSTGYQNYMPTSYTASGAPTGSMIVADVAYQYKPGFGFALFQWSDTTTVFRMSNVGYYRNRNSNGGSAGPITDAMTTGKTKCP